MNKYLKILLVAGLITYPASIQADAVLMSSSSTASSTAVVASMVIPQSKSITTTSIAKTMPVKAILTAAVTDTKVVWITAYASVPEETSDHPFITASGKTVADGIVAANFLPFGTKIQIPALFGDKVFTVQDRMNQKFNGRVDIWMPSVTQAINFGLQQAKIVILDDDVAVK